MRKLIFTGLLLWTTAAAGLAQGTRDLVVNEWLVWNVDNYEDAYGHRVSWVELYNNGYSTVNIASCYLVIESDGESISYRIPKNDSRTSIAPQGYTVIFCEGTHTKGTLHTNFTLDLNTKRTPVMTADSMMAEVYPDKRITLALLEANGRNTIDKVTYNLADQRPDVSVGRHPDYSADGGTVIMSLDATTPYATNITKETLPSHEIFRQADPYGYGMAVLAMVVVLIALTVLYLVFRTVGKIMVRRAGGKKEKAIETGDIPAIEKTVNAGISGEEISAIALALKMFEDDLHDHESKVLTINRVAKFYSPWSSKLYGLMSEPQRRR